MYKYTVRRLLLAVPVLLLSSLIVFGLMRVMPGDALTALMGESGNIGERELAKIRKDLRLDLPYHEQYLLWVWQMVSFRPGDSIFTGEPIAVSLAKAIPVTLELAALAMVLGLVIAVPIGVLSATRQDSAADYMGRVVAVSGLSFPDFWLGTLVITFVAIWFHWIPAIGYVSFWESPVRNLQQFLLPAAVLGFRLSAATMRMTRSTVLEVLREDCAPGRHGGGGDDLRAARHGPAHRGGDPLPRLPGGADQRHAGGGHAGVAESPGGPHLRVAGSADPLPVTRP